MTETGPDDATVTVWIAPYEELGEGERTVYKRVLSADEQARLARFQRTEPAQQFLTARILLRAALANVTKVPARDITFGYTAYGKPYVDRPDAARGRPFNISHTQGIVACAIGDGCTPGVDVEAVDRDLDTGQIARGHFAPAERAAVEQGPESERRSTFFQIWTLKEAYIKAHGKGLSIPLDGFRIDTRTASPTIKLDDDASDDGRRWRLVARKIDRRHQLAIAAHCPAGSTAVQIRLRWAIPRVDEGGRTYLNELKTETITR